MLNERQKKLYDYLKEVKVSTVATLAHILGYVIKPTEHNYTNAPVLYLDIREINNDPDAPGIITTCEGYVSLALSIEEAVEYAKNKLERALKLLKTYHSVMKKVEQVGRTYYDFDKEVFSIKDYGCIPSEEMEEMIKDLERMEVEEYEKNKED